MHTRRTTARRMVTSLIGAAALMALAIPAGEAGAIAKGIPAAQVCAGTKYSPRAPYGPFDWGTITVGVDRITYDISAGYEVTLCVKGGPTNTTTTFTGPATGELLTPTLKNGKHAALSHWSVVSATTVGP